MSSKPCSTRRGRIAPDYTRRARLLDGFAVVLLMLLMACLGVVTYALAVPR